MIVEKYEVEARQIAERLYRKDWETLSGKLRREIYEMAVEAVLNREGEDGRRFLSGSGHKLEDDSFDQW